MSALGWNQFWKDQKKSFHSIMILNTYFFGSRFEKLFKLKLSDRVLDYGCGPGLLIDYLAPLQLSLTGADINEPFIEECKIKHPNSLFISITTSPQENKRRLDSELNKNEFDFIILLSISQYFESESELDAVVGLLQHYLKPGGKMIIADVIDPATSALKDTLSLFIECLKKGKVLSFIRFMLYLVFSDYRTISRAAPLLVLTEQSIKGISRKYSLKDEKVAGLTLHKSRTNYILTKAD